MKTLARCLAILTAALATAATGLVAAAPAQATADAIPLTISNQSGRNDTVYLYVLGTNLDTGELGWSDSSGTFHPWPSTGATPTDAPDAAVSGPAAGDSTTIQLPHLSGRIYFSYGEKLHFQIVNDGQLVQPAVQNPTDPNRNVLFNWTEYTLNDDGLWINSTQVDFFSAPYQTGLKTADGHVVSTGRLKTDGFQHVVDALSTQPGWDNLAQKDQSGHLLRILAPSHALAAGQIATDTMADYVSRSWSYYRSHDLTIRPYDDDPGAVFTGRVAGDVMTIKRADGSVLTTIDKPSSDSVFGCYKDLFAPNNDIGAAVRTVCAALNRTTLLSNPNQPDATSTGFYQDSDTNYYAKAIHQQMVNGKAYAFAFDDVANQESLVHDGNPTAAYIQLDPFSGSASPIGDDGTGDNGGGDNGGGDGSGALPTGTGTIASTGGVCVDVPWADASNGNQLQLATCSGNSAQTWSRDGSTLQALGKCMDVSNSGTSNGTPVQLWHCNGSDAQQWQYDDVTETLVNSHSGKCLDGAGGTPVHDGQQLQIWDCTGAGNQQFSFADGTPEGQVTGLADKCMDVSNSGTSNGTPVQLWHCNGSDAQQWSFEADGTIQNQGNCLDVTNSGTANGVKLQIWHCNGSDAQTFTVDGQLIKNQHTGKCLDVTDNNSSNGTRLQMWDCYGSANQLWVTP